MPCWDHKKADAKASAFLRSPCLNPLHPLSGGFFGLWPGGRSRLVASLRLQIRRRAFLVVSQQAMNGLLPLRGVPLKLPPSLRSVSRFVGGLLACGPSFSPSPLRDGPPGDTAASTSFPAAASRLSHRSSLPARRCSAFAPLNSPISPVPSTSSNPSLLPQFPQPPFSPFSAMTHKPRLWEVRCGRKNERSAVCVRFLNSLSTAVRREGRSGACWRGQRAQIGSLSALTCVGVASKWVSRGQRIAKTFRKGYLLSA